MTERLRGDQIQYLADLLKQLKIKYWLAKFLGIKDKIEGVFKCPSMYTYVLTME